MRVLVGRAVGVALAAACVFSWVAGGIPVGFAGAREVAPPLHEGTAWSRYLAPEGTCRGDGEPSGAPPAQLFAMRCLLDWARRERGLAPLAMSGALSQSAALKAAAIVRCGDFSHTPCGTEFAATFDAAGWDGPAGENIAWGASLARSPRVLVDGWLHSDGHRENLFRADWRAQGLALLQVDSFAGERAATVWVHQFGK